MTNTLGLIASSTLVLAVLNTTLMGLFIYLKLTEKNVFQTLGLYFVGSIALTAIGVFAWSWANGMIKL